MKQITESTVPKHQAGGYAITLAIVRRMSEGLETKDPTCKWKPQRPTINELEKRKNDLEHPENCDGATMIHIASGRKILVSKLDEYRVSIIWIGTKSIEIISVKELWQQFRWHL